jgi:hypothetical protein
MPRSCSHSCPPAVPPPRLNTRVPRGPLAICTPCALNIRVYRSLKGATHRTPALPHAARAPQAARACMPCSPAPRSPLAAAARARAPHKNCRQDPLAPPPSAPLDVGRPQHCRAAGASGHGVLWPAASTGRALRPDTPSAPKAARTPNPKCPPAPGLPLHPTAGPAARFDGRPPPECPPSQRRPQGGGSSHHNALWARGPLSQATTRTERAPGHRGGPPATPPPLGRAVGGGGGGSAQLNRWAPGPWQPAHTNY